jgi:hypothetical protein
LFTGNKMSFITEFSEVIATWGQYMKIR